MDFVNLTLEHVATGGEHGNLIELVNRELQGLAVKLADDDAGDTARIAITLTLRRSADAVLVEPSVKVTAPERKLVASTAFVSTDPRTGEVTLKTQDAEQLPIPGLPKRQRKPAARAARVVLEVGGRVLGGVVAGPAGDEVVAGPAGDEEN